MHACASVHKKNRTYVLGELQNMIMRFIIEETINDSYVCQANN